jgi:hypothetical protein
VNSARGGAGRRRDGAGRRRDGAGRRRDGAGHVNPARGWRDLARKIARVRVGTRRFARGRKATLITSRTKSHMRHVHVMSGSAGRAGKCAGSASLLPGGLSTGRRACWPGLLAGRAGRSGVPTERLAKTWMPAHPHKPPRPALPCPAVPACPQKLRLSASPARPPAPPEHAPGTPSTPSTPELQQVFQHIQRARTQAWACDG